VSDVGTQGFPFIVEGTLIPASQVVQVTFDAGVPEVDQPGTYLAQLIINNEPPYGVQILPVTMNVLPVAPNVSFTSNSPVLVGDSMIFTNTSDPGKPPATQFTWNFGDGIPPVIGTMDPVSHLYTTFGTFTVTLTACNPSGCDTFTTDVVVWAVPVSSFTSNTPVMLGNPMEFSNTTTLGYPVAADYLWDCGDGGNSTNENPTHTYAATGTYTVTLRACNTVGCDIFEAEVIVEPRKFYLPIVIKK
jgi:PKD repeat protein